MSAPIKPANPANEIDAGILSEILRAAPQGEVILYSAMNAAIKGDVQGARYHVLNRVIRRLLRDRIAFSAIRNVGLKRLTDLECAESGPAFQGRIRRVARKGAATLRSVQEFEKLPREAQRAHNVSLAIMAAAGSVASNDNAKRIDTGMKADPVKDGAAARLAIEAAMRVGR